MTLGAIGEAVARIGAEIERRLPPTSVTQAQQGGEGMKVKLNCQRGRTRVKIEVNPSLRGHLPPVRNLACSDRVQEQFEALVEARCVSHGELFGGKICAALGVTAELQGSEHETQPLGALRARQFESVATAIR